MPPRRGGRRRGTVQRPRYQPQRNISEEVKQELFDYSEKKEDVECKTDATFEMEIKNEPIEHETMTNYEISSDEKNKNEIELKKEPTESKDLENTEGKSEAQEKENDNQEKENDNREKENDNQEKEVDVNASVALPFTVKVSHLPANYVLSEFQKHLKTTFRIKNQKIISPGKNSPWIILPCAKKEEQENIVRLLHNHIWKKKALRAIAVYPNPNKRKAEDADDPESKKLKTDELPVLTLEEEILSESLPLYNVPYEEQNRLTLVDVEILSNKLHAFMCVRNPALTGWAEAMCEKNNGAIFKIEPLKTSPILKGYRNKCKFRVGKNTEGETTVGFCLNDNENKILGVQPGDKLIHLPDSMKYAAKKFEDFIRTSGKEPYVKKQKSGFWDHIIIRITPEGSLMMVVVMYHNHLPVESVAEIKNQVKEFFVNGDGKDCKLYSLYFQVMCDKSPVLPPGKLELLHGETHFFENICGLKFYVGPFSILNVNSSSSENVYKSIVELAEPTPETTVIDLCSGTGGIAFTIADKCKSVIAIESHNDHIKDALKTKELNNIENVEFIKGKVEDELVYIFEKLGDVPIIPIIDPPRQGLVQKAISQLRAHKSIKKLVYVCSNSKMGAKNFLDLCAAADKKEGTFGNPLNVVFEGLPFLPIRAIPIDVAPYTVNNTIIILFERVDPSTFPPAKNSPPLPIKRPQMRKDEKKKKKNIGKRMSRRSRSNNKKFRKGSASGSKSGMGYGGHNFRRGNHSGGGSGGYNTSRFLPPLLRQMDPALSLVAKYERRIAELEQQDRAFKAGLTMGLQVLGTRGGPGGGPGGGGSSFDNFSSNFDPNGADNFGGFRNQFSRDRLPWRDDRGFNNMGVGYGSGGSAGNNFGNRFNTAAFNNYNDLNNFGHFGNISNSFNSNFGPGGGGGNFRNYQAGKFKRETYNY